MRRRERSIQSVLVISSISFVLPESSATRLIMVSHHQQSDCGLSNQERTTSYQYATSKCLLCTNGLSCDLTSAERLLERRIAVGVQSSPNLSRKESFQKRELMKSSAGPLTDKSAGDSVGICSGSVIDV